MAYLVELQTALGRRLDPSELEIARRNYNYGEPVDRTREQLQKRRKGAKSVK